MLERMVSGSNFGILNWDSPTRLPGNANPSSPDVSLASASHITSTNWQTKTNLGSAHLPILINLQMDVTITSIQHCTSINLKKANWDLSRSSVPLLLPTINSHLLPSADQHGFRPGHSTTSALLQLTSDIATGFNQRKPPHRTVCDAC